MKEYEKTPGVLHPAVLLGSSPNKSLAAEHRYTRHVTDQLVRVVAPAFLFLLRGGGIHAWLLFFCFFSSRS